MEEKDMLKFMVAPAAEVRRDLRRNLPWVVGLLIATVLYVLVSSTLIRQFESQWTFLHASYFTVINMTTVGFGDVVPSSHGGKVIAGINAFAGLLLFGFLVAVLSLALQPAGCSATLTSAGEHRGAEQVRHHEDKKVENDVAELLESLATLVRTADRNEESSAREGRVRIHIRGDGPIGSAIDVFVHVDAG